MKPPVQNEEIGPVERAPSPPDEKQALTPAPPSNIRRYIWLTIGSVLLLISFLTSTFSWNALSGQGPSAGYELLFIMLFIAYPLLVIGGLMVLRSLMQGRSGIFLLLTGGALLLFDHLVSVTLSSPDLYQYVGKIVNPTAELIGVPFLLIGSGLIVEGLMRLAIQLGKRSAKEKPQRSNVGVSLSDGGERQNPQPEPVKQTQPLPLTSAFVSKGSAQRGTSRLTVIIGLSVLVGLAIVDGGLMWRIPLYFKGNIDVSAVSWSPDGKHIASAGMDKTVQVWDATNGGHVYTYRGHTASVSAVAWSPDGKRIASAGMDKTVRVWDATNGGHAYFSTE